MFVVVRGSWGVEKGRACDRRVIAACLGTGCLSLRNEPNEERKRTAIRLTGRQADAEKQEKRRRSPEACAVCDKWKCKCNPIALHRLYWGAGSEAAANKQRERRVNGRSQAFNLGRKDVAIQKVRNRVPNTIRSLARSVACLLVALVALGRLGWLDEGQRDGVARQKMKRDVEETYAHIHSFTRSLTHGGTCLTIGNPWWSGGFTGGLPPGLP